MGLSEGRRKQRLVGAAQTRNAGWSNDATLPGQRLLASMGWAAGQGIGRTANGMADPVKVAFKMDNRGIGAQRAEREARASGLADAWIGGNGELGDLFERLNRQEPIASSSTSVISEQSADDAADEVADEKSAKRAAKKQKREEKEQRRAEKAAKKAVKEARARNKLIAAGPTPARVMSLNPRMAARAKYLRAKRLVGSDAASLNEILGIASPSTSGTSSPMPAMRTAEPANVVAAIESTLDAAKTKESKDKKGKRKAIAVDDDVDGTHSATLSASKAEKKSTKKDKKRSRDISAADDDTEASSKSGRKEKKRKKQELEDGLKKDEGKGDERQISARQDDSIPVVPMSAAASQPALPSSSDPSFDAPGGGRVSHLSVQEYLQNKLTLRRAAIVRKRREKDQGVWHRAAAAAVGAS